MDKRKFAGLALATAAAAMFSAVGVTGVAHAEDATVKCAGINSCKGTSECKSATNECKGQNTCKGHGWLSATEKECTAKHGKVVN